MKISLLQIKPQAYLALIFYYFIVEKNSLLMLYMGLEFIDIKATLYYEKRFD